MNDLITVPMNPKMKPALILTVAFIPLMIAYMAFLAQRDRKLFEAYNQPTPKEVYCSQLPQPHPDCTVE
jgi:hypothetical protein